MKTVGTILIVWGALMLLNLQLAWLAPNLPPLNVAGRLGPQWLWWLAGILLIAAGAVLRQFNFIKKTAIGGIRNNTRANNEYDSGH